MNPRTTGPRPAIQQQFIPVEPPPKPARDLRIFWQVLAALLTAELITGLVLLFARLLNK